MNKPSAKQNLLPPTLLTIFGITGDLSQKKLLPSLYELEKTQALPKHFYIVGVTRRPITKQEIRRTIKANVVDPENKFLVRLMQRIHVAHIQITKDEEYPKLRSFLDNLEEQYGVCFNRLFYLAIPPSLFAAVVQHLGAGQLHKGCLKHRSMESRLLIEKPFGYDLASAKELIRRIAKYFKDPQIYRIDHFLAKETVQNIIKFRFENPLIDAIWNNRFVDHVQITAAETLGIGFRKDFYEQTGALRDFLQSHLLQLMALVAMEPPKQMTASAIQEMRLSLLKAIDPIKPNQVNKLSVRGQYLAGRINSQTVKGYAQEVSHPKSAVETYAAVQFNVSNRRWRGVPFVLRTGKRLPHKLYDVTLVFKDRSKKRRLPNTITLRIEPDEGIVLHLLAKQPGLTNETQPVKMEFLYSRTFDGPRLSAYERLLLNAVQGDRTLFTANEEVLASWRAVEPILRAWQKGRKDLEYYKAGSWGPKAADRLVKQPGYAWLNEELA